MCVFKFVGVQACTDVPPVRQVHEKNEFGESNSAIKYVCAYWVSLITLTSSCSRPFIIDLESTNGTKVNDEPVPTSRYFELKLGDGMHLKFLYRSFQLEQTLFWQE